MELEKEVVTLKNKIKESGRYKLREQLAAAQATNAKLREALKFYMVPPIGQLNDHCVAAAKLGMAALALPSDESALQERLKEERERCAVAAWMYYARVCKQKGLNPHHYGEWIASDAIRSLK